MAKMKIRLNREHAVLAKTEELAEGVKLVAIEPIDGPMPEVDHLVGGQPSFLTKTLCVEQF